MLSYQHGYHAGGFADVVKHVTLTQIIHYMGLKEKPLFYLETHSGRGVYDLKDGQATKTAEFRQGISLLWEQRKQAPSTFSFLLDAIRSLNAPGTLRYYPGSPYLAISGLRAQDRIALSELHTGEFSHLEQLSRHGKQVLFNHSDGLRDLNALLPPPERRGLIFLDPSYEIKEEYRQIPDAIKTALARFSTGVYCLWYPIIDRHFHNRLLCGLKNIRATHVLRLEFYLTARPKNGGMTGCGLWIINPPFTLAEEMKTAMDFLRTLFNPGVSSWLIE